MTARTSLPTLRRLRERQRDAAQAVLAAAHQALALFEAKRRGWRAEVAAEERSGGNNVFAATGLWLEAARNREWRGAAEAERLRAAVAEAERAYRAADLALEQVLHLARAAAKKEQRMRAALEQKRLDDFKSRAADDDRPRTD
ncbi:MAG: hypothetical protein ACOC3D_08675 [Pseudomonadota bacterium]